MAFNALKINHRTMKRHYETDKVKKTDFTVKVLSVESSLNTLNNHCEDALYEVNADIYYKGNRIDSFFCCCPFGKYKNSEPDENGEFAELLPKGSEIEAQLDARLKSITEGGVTLDEIFDELVLDQYIERVLRFLYKETAEFMPVNRMTWAFERLHCMLCIEDDKCHLIIGSSLFDLEMSMSEDTYLRNGVIVDQQDKLFVSDWDRHRVEE